jgi:hypothetical protein
MAALPSSRHPERERLVDGDDSGGLGDRLMVERERADEASFDATQPAGAAGCPSTVSSDTAIATMQVSPAPTALTCKSPEAGRGACFPYVSSSSRRTDRAAAADEVRVC